MRIKLPQPDSSPQRHRDTEQVKRCEGSDKKHRRFGPHFKPLNWQAHSLAVFVAGGPSLALAGFLCASASLW